MINERKESTTTLLDTMQEHPKKKIRVAVNGFGRIGRAFVKACLENKNLQIVAINDLSLPETLLHLFKYDSTYGNFPQQVTTDGKSLFINDLEIKITAEKSPENLPWKDLDIDVVIESTGRFTKDDLFLLHIKAGAKKVIVSAPAKGSSIKTIVLGVNDSSYNKEQAVSNGSCTTNCIAPIVKALNDQFSIKNLVATTIHAVTAEQNLVDSAPPSLHLDLRRARSALNNIIPTTSGASSAICEVFPNLKGKVEVGAIRVPVLCGSLTDFTFFLDKDVSQEEINQILSLASTNPSFKGVLSVTNDPIVSSDIIGNKASSIADLSLTKVVSPGIVKIFSWYDNEWGYANRLTELAELINLA